MIFSTFTFTFTFALTLVGKVTHKFVLDIFTYFSRIEIVNVLNEFTKEGREAFLSNSFLKIRDALIV